MILNSLYTSARSGSAPSSVASRTDYQRDFDRIVFSSAFRRLQNKTQVFPLPGSVFVHNRLTHSLEVSSVGRSIGSLVGEFIHTRYYNDLDLPSREFYLHNLSNVLAAACLCHDVGNPAFGHSGEDAIATYFEKNEGALRSLFTEGEWMDLVHFEGNANAMRTLTHRQNGKDQGGIQLTLSTLSCIAKYPCESLAKDKKVLHRKKFGFFQSQKQVFMEMAHRTGMLMESSAPLVFKRHPFVWLVEAADDICYNIIDMEDAHRLGIVSTSDVEDLFLQLIKGSQSDHSRVKQRMGVLTNANERISYLRAKVINTLVSSTVELYKEQLPIILNGTLSESLVDTYSRENPAIGAIQKFSREKIYRHRSVVEIENAGYNVMYELLDHFIPCVIKPVEKRKSYDRIALELIPPQFLYPQASLYEQVLGVVDFVAGMTDNFATDLYRKIKGIDIGMTM